MLVVMVAVLGVGGYVVYETAQFFDVVEDLGPCGYTADGPFKGVAIDREVAARLTLDDQVEFMGGVLGVVNKGDEPSVMMRRGPDDQVVWAIALEVNDQATVETPTQIAGLRVTEPGDDGTREVEFMNQSHMEPGYAVLTADGQFDYFCLLLM